MPEKIIEEVSIGLEPLLSKFMEHTASEVAALENIVASGNMAEALRMGHNIKGSALNYGFSILAEIGRNIEISAGNEDMAQLKLLLVDLKKYLKNVEIVFGA